MTYPETVLIFLGAVGLMTLYITAQAIVTQQRAYAWYALYALCWFVYFTIRVFDTPLNRLPISDSIQEFNRIGVPMLSYICYYNFADAFLDLRQFLPAAFRRFRQAQIVLLVYAGFVLAAVIYNPHIQQTTNTPYEYLHTLIRLSLSVLSVWGIRLAWLRRDPVANYFVTGSGLLLIGSLVSMLMSIFRHTNNYTINDLLSSPLFYMQIGIALELLCFSLGLSYKNKLTESQKAIVEQNLLLEREQHQNEQVRAQFLTNVSHEFRTPLTLLLGPASDLLQHDPANPAYQLIHRNTTRLLTLVNQVLDLAKFDASQLQPQLRPGDFGQFLRLLVGAFTSMAESRGISLTLDTSQFAAGYSRLFDPDKTEKIITNILANALKFTSAGGSVWVRLLPDPDTDGLKIQIEDTGPGIPPDQQSRIFDRFYQSPTGTGNTAGTGIGLALVRELLTVLSGSVSVDSQLDGPKTGTTFTLTLPCPVAPDAPAETPETLAPEPLLVAESVAPALPVSPLSPTPTDDLPLVLVVDDNDDMRQYVRIVLADQYRFLEAVNGREGLAVASETLPDLVVCDLMMPELDGFGFCRVLKTQPTTDHIPVIMLTAKAGLESRIEGFGLGADDYLAKPFHPAELRARVANLLRQREALRERFSGQLRLQPTGVLDGRNAASPPLRLSVEEQFVQRAIGVVEEHLADSSFSADQFAEAMNLSRMQLHRKLRAVTNQSATEFVRQLRLQRAADLLHQRAATVSEVAFLVGFESLSYFTKAFKEQFGVVPSAYVTMEQKDVTAVLRQSERGF